MKGATYTPMKRGFGFVIVAALLVAEAASATVVQLTCHGAVGEDQPIDFTIAVDIAQSVVTEGDLRWTTTDDDETIDWDLHRQSSAIRGVVLTGADAGVMIVGECNQSVERDLRTWAKPEPLP